MENKALGNRERGMYSTGKGAGGAQACKEGQGSGKVLRLGVMMPRYTRANGDMRDMGLAVCLWRG